MPTLIPSPSVVESAGTKPKRIEEYVGRVNTGHETVSVARMTSPGGWEEPGQRPEFDEVTLVLRGRVRVEHEDGTLDVEAGQAVLTRAGEWIRYSTPDEGAPNTLRSASPRSAPTPSTATTSDELQGHSLFTLVLVSPTTTCWCRHHLVQASAVRVSDDSLPIT